MADCFLFDREGLFPVAWADTVAGLAAGLADVRLATCPGGADRGRCAARPGGRRRQFRRRDPARPRRTLAAAAAAPAVDQRRDDPALARHASGYQQAVDLAAELTQALAGERAAVPLAASPALGRSLLLAAGLGLGTLAWTLWREREPTDPLLALERFADLSARVSFEPDRVRVRLPLGPRHSDLSVHGLLADVHGVPWFGGRVVEFSGG